MKVLIDRSRDYTRMDSIDADRRVFESAAELLDEEHVAGFAVRVGSCLTIRSLLVIHVLKLKRIHQTH